MLNSQQKRKLARLISRLDRLAPAQPLPVVENGREIGAGFRIGITGPLGAGKSTLINKLVSAFRKKDLTVGVVAVDPTSPFTGGAVLGDRVRMSDLVMDDGVFIRSLATRGASGGLAANAVDAADLLDISGFDRIIIETVGVGQTEVDIMEACDCTVVVLEPSSGDSIQAIKAGLMEIADLFIVNKKDLKGADRFILDLETSIEMRMSRHRPDVLATLAVRGDGVPELCDWLEDHYNKLSGSSAIEQRRADQRFKRIRRAAETALMKEIWHRIPPEEVEAAADSGDPVREAAWKLIEQFFLPNDQVDDS